MTWRSAGERGTSRGLRGGDGAGRSGAFNLVYFTEEERHWMEEREGTVKGGKKTGKWRNQAKKGTRKECWRLRRCGLK